MSKTKGRFRPMSDLHVLLARAFPEHRTADYDVFDVAWLAKKLKITEQGVYRWLRDNELPASRAKQIVKIKGCRKKLSDFLPYMS